MKKTIIFLFVALISFAALYNSEYWRHKRLIYEIRNIHELVYTKISNKYDRINQIEKIYVINLDRHSERMERMEQILKELNLGIDIERFPAISGKDVSLINKDTKNSIIVSDIYNKQKKIEEGVYNIICSEDNQDTEIHLTKEILENPNTRLAGEIGCFCSHKEVWRKISKNNLKKVLILEDDIDFLPFSKLILENSLKNIPSNFGLVYLGIMNNYQSLDYSTTKLHYTKIIKNIASGEAYIITNEASKILYQNLQIYKSVDLYMSDEIEKNSITGFAVFPILTKQVLDSKISSGK